MSVLVVGCNHRSADLTVLERLAVPGDEVAKVLSSLLALPHVLEAAILSTCNRVEVYAHVSRFHAGLQEVRSWLAERGDLHPQDFDDLHYAYHDDRAAAHLFSVAAGLDSMVVGERQVALQVKGAMESAQQESAAGRVLLGLFRKAVSAGRRVRRETDVNAGASSMVDVGLDVAARHLGGTLDGSTVLIVGAGKIGGLAAARLLRDGVQDPLVWNRNPDKAIRLAARTQGSVVGVDGLGAALALADVVICTTGAPQPVIDADQVAQAMVGRPERPLALLDLAMPRNVDVGAGLLDGVALLDIADVRRETDRQVTGEVLDHARAIVDQEAARFLAWTRAIEVEPTIKALRQRAEAVRQAEVQRLERRLSHLDDDQRAAVDALTRGIVNTLLHEPTVRLKTLADRGGAEHYAGAVRELFDLDE